MFPTLTNLTTLTTQWRQRSHKNYAILTSQKCQQNVSIITVHTFNNANAFTVSTTAYIASVRFLSNY